METVRYVIVVHGMGEARKNETVLSVINRFAEARAAKSWPQPDDVLTLGKASSQTGRVHEGGGCRYGRVPPVYVPWLEFGGVPKKPDATTTVPFLGAQGAANDGENLRFADAHWADLLAEDFPDVGQDPIAWTDGLIGRLRRKDEYAVRSHIPEARVPEWSLRILELIQQTVSIIHAFARLRAQEFDTLVFDKYLGDVQLYGEFAQSRGRALRRFHRLIHRIEEAHRKQEEGRAEPREARYTVIAHSLGTVMSMDALLYACARPDVRTGRTPGLDPNLPYPAYISDSDLVRLNQAGGNVQEALKQGADLGYLDTSWIRRVDSFVTLGSPIDKFLHLWWMNYSHFASTDWMEPSLTDPNDRIVHLNYSEEQDPVGHKLDLAQSAPAFKSVFETQEDRVYVRSPIPGLAHVAYWEDRDLFKWLLHRAVDLENDGRKRPQWFKPDAYQKVLNITYLWVPHLIILTSLFLFTWAWTTDSLHGAALAAAGFSVTLLLGKRVMDLFLWWRQVLKAKEAGSHSADPNTIQELGEDILTYAQGPIPYSPDKEGAIKAWEQSWFRIWVRFASYGSLLLAGGLFGLYESMFHVAYPEGMTRTARAVEIVVVMGLCTWVWERLLPSGNQQTTTGKKTVLTSIFLVAASMGLGALLFQGIPAEPLYHALSAMLGARFPRLLFLGMSYAGFTAIIMTYRYRAFRFIRKAMAAPAKQTTQPDFRRYAGA